MFGAAKTLASKLHGPCPPMPTGSGIRQRRRFFPVEPILLIGQRAPRVLHALVTKVGRVIGGSLRQLLTIVSIFAEMIGLFHDVLLH